MIVRSPNDRRPLVLRWGAVVLLLMHVQRQISVLGNWVHRLQGLGVGCVTVSSEGCRAEEGGQGLFDTRVFVGVRHEQCKSLMGFLCLFCLTLFDDHESRRTGPKTRVQTDRSIFYVCPGLTIPVTRDLEVNSVPSSVHGSCSVSRPGVGQPWPWPSGFPRRSRRRPRIYRRPSHLWFRVSGPSVLPGLTPDSWSIRWGRTRCSGTRRLGSTTPLRGRVSSRRVPGLTLTGPPDHGPCRFRFCLS